MMKVIDKKGPVTILGLSGSLELGKEVKLKEEVARETASAPVKDVLLDLTDVEFIDSACLGVLVTASRKLKKEGKSICVCGPREEVRAIFQITRLDKILLMFDNQEEALAHFHT